MDKNRMAVCKWHRCSRTFIQTEKRQRFCSRRCQTQRNSWKMIKGRPLVDLLLEDRHEELVEAVKKLKAEVKNETLKALVRNHVEKENEARTIQGNSIS